jgi:D-alanine-D-alanine ligase
MKKKILVLVHSQLVPPENVGRLTSDERMEKPWITEYDVISTLKKNGHTLKVLGVYSDLQVIKDAITDFNPHLVFNLLEEFDGNVLFDQNVVSFLELLGIPYTGSNPRGLMIARDKALTKKILTYHRIKTPKFFVYPKKRKIKLPPQTAYPLIVKCLNEEASYGIAQASIVQNEEKFLERLQYVHEKLGVDAIAEEFIEGREFYVGVMGNYQLKTLPIWELCFDKAQTPSKEIYSRRAKWNKEYRKRKGIDSKPAELSIDLEKKIHSICRKAYKDLNLTGYARIDLRMDKENNIYVIEANPNPNIAMDDEFASSAKYKGLNYRRLLDKLLTYALK